MNNKITCITYLYFGTGKDKGKWSAGSCIAFSEKVLTEEDARAYVISIQHEMQADIDLSAATLRVLSGDFTEDMKKAGWAQSAR